MKKYNLKGNYPSGKVEKGFMAELTKNMRADGWIVYHIQDIGAGYRFLDMICVSPEGEVVFMELKKIKGYTFNMSQFEDSQVILLRKLDARKQGLAIVGIWSIEKNDYVLTTFSDLANQANEKGGIKIFTK